MVAIREMPSGRSFERKVSFSYKKSLKILHSPSIHTELVLNPKTSAERHHFAFSMLTTSLSGPWNNLKKLISTLHILNYEKPIYQHQL